MFSGQRSETCRGSRNGRQVGDRHCRRIQHSPHNVEATQVRSRVIPFEAFKEVSAKPVVDFFRQFLDIFMGAANRLNVGPAQLHAEAVTTMSSAGTSVFTETCGQVRPAKLSRTV